MDAGGGEVTVTGPGKYDDACTAARESTKALGCILIVVGGEHGDGFSAQLTMEMMENIPRGLRALADQIEADRLRVGGSQPPPV